MSVPSAPLIVIRPAATNQTLEFYWAPPASDGGSAITSYTLACAAISFSQSTDSAGRYFKVTGLTNGVDHTFTLKATNSIGDGPEATYRTVQPGNKPQPPIGVSQTVSADESATTVTWTNPTNTGGASLIRNLVTAVPLTEGGQEDTAHSIKRATYGFQTNRVVAGLSTAKDYNVYVQSINDPGYSVLSSFAAVTRGVFTLNDISGNFAFWADMGDTRFVGTEGGSVTYIREKSSNAAKMDLRPPTADNEFWGPSVFPVQNGSTIGGYSTITFGPFGAIASRGVNDYRLGSNVTGGLYYVAQMNVQSNSGNDQYGHPTLLYDGYYSNYAVDPGNSNDPLFQGSNNSAVSRGVAHLYVPGNTVYDQYSNVRIPGRDSTFLLSVNGFEPTTATDTVFQGLNQDRGYGNRGLHANVAEVIVVNSTITDPQSRKIEGYLAWKYGINAQLPVGHPYRTARPKNTVSVDPTGLPGGIPYIWLDGQDILSQVSSDGVSTVKWLDRSGRGATACNIVGDIQKTTAGPYFSSGIMEFSHPFNANQLTNFMVLAPQGGGGYLTNRPGGAGDSPAWLMNYNSPSTFEWFFGGYPLPTINFTTSTNMLMWKGEYGNSFQLAYNASHIGETPYTGDPYSLPYGKIGFGLVGNICEYITYPYPLSTNETKFIEGYLAWKWAAQDNLPANHTYKAAAPSNYSTFAPPMVSSLHMWLDASDPLATGTTPSNGASISQWYDKSGKSNHAYAATGTQPTYSKTARTYAVDILDPNGTASNHSLLIPTASNMFSDSYFTVFIAFTPRETTGFSGLFELEPANHSNAYGYAYQYATRDVLWDLGGGSIYTNGTLATGGTYVTTYRRTIQARFTTNTGNNIGSNGFLRTYVDGANSNITDISQAWLGRTNVFNHTYNGSLHEVLIYKGNLGGGDEREIRDYLYNKWCKAAPLATPTQIPNLVLWLDATDPLGTGTNPGNGTTLSNWVDKSGLSNNAQTPVGSNITSPTYYTNATESYVRFNGDSNSAKLLTASNVYLTDKPYTIFAVERMDNLTGYYSQYPFGTSAPMTTNYRALIFNKNSATGTDYRLTELINGGGTTCVWNNYGSSNSGLGSPVLIETGITRVWTVQHNAELYSYAVDNIQNMHLLLNGQVVASNMDSNLLNLVSGGFTVGGWREDGYAHYNGDIKELLVFSGYLNDGDRQKVESYLTSKWLVERTVSNPSQVSGLAAWFDARDPLGTGTRPASGTLLSNWIDKSSNSRNFVVTNGSNPVYKNFGPISYLEFVDTSNNYMEMLNPSFLVGTYYTIFIVQEGVPEFDGTILGDSYPYTVGYGNFQIRYNGAANNAIWRTGGSNRPTTDATFASQRFNFRELLCFTASHTFSYSANANINAGGVGIFRYTAPPDKFDEAGRSAYGQVNGYAAPSDSNYIISNLSTLCLYNAQLDQTSNINSGRIFEILFYTGSMTGEDRLRVKNYLSRKWDIPMKDTYL